MYINWKSTQTSHSDPYETVTEYKVFASANYQFSPYLKKQEKINLCHEMVLGFAGDDEIYIPSEFEGYKVAFIHEESEIKQGDLIAIIKLPLILG